jgi:hypothetical protein
MNWSYDEVINGNAKWAVFDDDGGTVCTTNSEDHVKTIAAVPEMLDALRSVCEASGALDFHTPLGEAIFWADVAVAKAEGRS